MASHQHIARRASYVDEGNNLITSHKEFTERVSPLFCCYYVGIHGVTDHSVKYISHSRTPAMCVFCCSQVYATTFTEYEGCGTTVRSVGEGCMYGESFKPCSVGLVDYRTNQKCAILCCPCMTVACNAYAVARCCFRFDPCCGRWMGTFGMSGCGYQVDVPTFLKFTTDLISGTPEAQTMV